ncbi:MAG: PAC2 family protein [Candidatus Thermoplasmatota archaeon]|nr:PAC2 family protein [Candidatus Thermoplasmatota archaeon]MEE3083666.1 PAC2 family protein [Candidatus Thermoplasmatota archaeon]|tara:strand:+ start:401 stop:1165 length:765 start_codon:yes stop_codon:yes gene_type:complete
MTGDGYALVLHGDADPSRLGGTAICGFSSTGMVGVIAASHIIRAMDLEQMGTVLDENFPAMALVQESVPKHPVRVYQGEGIGVFTSEIQFPSAYDVKFAETVLKWFVEGGFDRLIIIDGVVSDDIGEKSDSEIWGVSSHPLGRKALATAGISRMKQGIVAGIAGYLLSEGDRRGLDVTALLAECNPMYPDARSAAYATEALSELIDFEIPLDELLEDARKIEENVRDMFERSQSMLPAPEGYDVSLTGDDPMIN